MEGPEKRVRLDTGEEYSLGELETFPRDVLVLILEHVVDVYDLFNLGKVNKKFKRFLKENQVFPKWLMRQLGVKTMVEANAYVQNVLSMIEEDEEEIYVRWTSDDESTEFRVGCVFQDGSLRFYVYSLGLDRQTFNHLIRVGQVEGEDDDYPEGNEFTVRNLTHPNTIVKFIKYINDLIPIMRLPMRTNNNLPFTFDCQRPFHIAALHLYFHYALFENIPEDLVGMLVDELFPEIVTRLETGELRVTDVSESGQERRLINYKML